MARRASWTWPRCEWGKKVDTTGAGDAFAAGFLFSLIGSGGRAEGSWTRRCAGRPWPAIGPRVTPCVVVVLSSGWAEDGAEGATRDTVPR